MTVLLCLRGPRVNLRPCCPICLICPTELCCLDSGYVIPLIRGLECGVPYVLATGSQIRPSSGCSAHCGQEAPRCPCPVAGSVGQALCPGTSGWAGDAQGLWASLLSPGLRPSTCLSGVFAALASQKSTLPPPRVPQGCLRSAASGRCSWEGTPSAHFCELGFWVCLGRKVIVCVQLTLELESLPTVHKPSFAKCPPASAGPAPALVPLLFLPLALLAPPPPSPPVEYQQSPEPELQQEVTVICFLHASL